MVCPSQDDEQFSVRELSYLNEFPEGYVFVLLKGFFDGGNRADSRHYRTATLASIVAPNAILGSFKRSWETNLKNHNAAYLHTVDAVALKGIYKSWTEVQRDRFILDCGKIIADSILRKVHGKIVGGLVPCTITIDLKDFKRVQTEIPSGPQDATEILAMQSFTKMVEYGFLLSADFFELFFDRSEPFRGHISDRLRNPRFRKEMQKHNIDVDRRFVLGTELDARNVPELQAADLFAWCVGHRIVRFEWQQAVLDITHDEEFLDYA